MAPKIHPIHPQNRDRNNGIVYEVVRPQRKKLSRYKLKKQASLVEKIIDDPQIMSI